MLNQELNNIKYDLKFLDSIRKKAENIKTAKIRSLVRGKIHRLRRVLKDISSCINIGSDIEKYPDITNNEKGLINDVLYNLAHCVENMIASQQSTEVDIIKDIENFKGEYEPFRNQLIKIEQFEIGYLKKIKRVLAKAYLILKKHKT